MLRRSTVSSSAGSPAVHPLRRVGAVVVATTLTAFGLVGLSGTASAAPCGTVKDTTIKNNLSKVGESHYTINCSGGQVLVTGRVQDTKADGHCIEIKVVIGTTYQTAKACGNGTSQNIAVRGNGNSAEVYTYRL